MRSHRGFGCRRRRRWEPRRPDGNDNMNRRQLLKLLAGSVVATCIAPRSLVVAQTAPASDFIEDFFLQILRGFLKNAAATSKDFTVCDYPDGTKLKGCCTPSGKTYVSVARMLPAMAEWIGSGRATNIDGQDLRRV